MTDLSHLPRKTCGQCHDTKLHVHFYKSKRSRDGLSTECRKCRRSNVKRTSPNYMKYI